jgi:hypothetical protein
VAESPTNVVGIAQEPLKNVASQAIDFAHIAKFIWTELHNLAGFELAMKQQVGHALLPLVRQHALYGLPQFMAIVLLLPE